MEKDSIIPAAYTAMLGLTSHVKANVKAKIGNLDDYQVLKSVTSYVNEVCKDKNSMQEEAQSLFDRAVEFGYKGQSYIGKAGEKCFTTFEDYKAYASQRFDKPSAIKVKDERIAKLESELRQAYDTYQDYEASNERLEDEKRTLQRENLRLAEDKLQLQEKVKTLTNQLANATSKKYFFRKK